MDTDTDTDNQARGSLESRVKAIEDRLEILDLIACHPLGADTGAVEYVEQVWTNDGVLDLAGGKGATGNVAIAAMLAAPGHQSAIAAGLAHLAGLPHIVVTGDTAVVTSYLSILAPQPAGDPVEVPNHGASRGFRVHRVGANRWELIRSTNGWKIARRTFRSLDGTAPARDLLRSGLHGDGG